MSAAPILRRPRLVTRIWLFLLLCNDGAIAALGIQFWTHQRDGFLETAEVVPLDTWGVSSAVGAVTAALALIASIAGPSARVVGEGALTLAWLRLITLPIVLVSLAAGVGITGLTGGYVSVLMLLEAVAALLCVRVARKHTWSARNW